MRKRLALATLLAVGLAIGLALGGVLHTPTAAHSAAPQAVEQDEQQMAELRKLADNLALLFRRTAESVSPAVVWINATRTVRVRTIDPFFDSPFFDDPFFRRFFGPETPRGWEPREREYKQQGLGSGVIIDARGYILTNNHVVAEADELEVKLADGRTFEAKVTGTDPDTELAVIKLEGDVEDLPVAVLGDSDDLHVGEWVIAIGNPLGLAHTVSAGIVSAKGRSIGLARYENLIQTDAAINRGNSGGPLVNLHGEVIGINTAIISSSGGNIGIGLAIPINMAKGILDDLKAGRPVERGFLGIRGKDLTPELAQQFDYEGTTGALVSEIVPDSPAEAAGMKAGDIIIRWEGKQVRNFAHLRELVAATDPNKTAAVEIWRDGAPMTLQVKVGRLGEFEQAGVSTWTGIRVAPVTDEVRNRFGRKDLRGVVVAEVAEDSPAAKRGIEEGDVILAVKLPRERVAFVASPGQFEELVSRVKPGEGVALLVLDRRGRGSFWMSLRRD